MILLTGATGFIGSHLLERLLADHLPVRALVRKGTPHQFLTKRGVEVAEGDVTDPVSLRAAAAGVRTVVHLVGLIKEPPGITFESVVAEGTRSLVAAAEAGGVERFVYLSAIGAAPDALSRYHRTKAVAEAAVRAGAFDHVIVRPSIVYGPGDGLVSQIARVPLPVPGDGTNQVQPIWVGDLAEVLCRAVQSPDVRNATFEVGGPHPLTFNEMVRQIGEASGRRLPHPHLPRPLLELNAWLCDSCRGLIYRLGLEPPVTRDLLLMLDEDNTCDPTPAEAAFGVRFTPFGDGLRQWLAPAG